MGTADHASPSEKPAETVVSKSPIEQEIDSFEKSTDSLIATFPLTIWFVQSAWRGVADALRQFIRTKCLNVRTAEQTIAAEVPAALVRECSLISRKRDQTEIALKMISRSFVVSLINQYDSFLGGLLRALFYKRPELRNASDRVLTFKDLKF